MERGRFRRVQDIEFMGIVKVVTESEGLICGREDGTTVSEEIFNI